MAPVRHLTEISAGLEDPKMAIMIALPSATPAHLSGASLESRSRGYLMYAVIRRYPFAPSARAAVDGNVREILVPRLQAVPEFVTYY
jgi:hypothetical protein